MRGAAAAFLAAIGLGLAGCAGDATSTGTAPLAVVHAATSSIAGHGKASVRGVRRRSGVSPNAPAGKPTPPSPRTRPAAPPRALPASSAPRLAAPACEQYAAGLAGTFPEAVQARGAERALALLTESVASALLGMPITVPAASRAERDVLEGARARISTALVAGDDAKATAIARATKPRIAAYAQALGITGCA